MKATQEINTEGLKSRSELSNTAATQLGLNLPIRCENIMKLAQPFRLRAGDVVLYENKPCPVIRVSECAAVLALEKPAREFTTIFGKQVRIKPRPVFVRISSNSEIPILNRKGGK